ncbi:putative XkdX family phage protein [Anoxybacillus vitaminiphilus]|uniref:Putative XkdX family phage protein n=1 Tax=Paranoxybacillus vitaminiphilus TaxID=581036 RepID=A0A327YLE5_9BACL|nr:XkdX family protein [Anoxybacillus vitaminiphilus]RAK21157.1 putative XkdX family phage protein [Anoxybacillus vitaminiphilus]
MWFNTIKRFYDNGHPSYTNESLKIFVKTGMITAEQYEEITGEPYTA